MYQYLKELKHLRHFTKNLYFKLKKRWKYHREHKKNAQK